LEAEAFAVSKAVYGKGVAATAAVALTAPVVALIAPLAAAAAGFAVLFLEILLSSPAHQ